MEPTQAKPAVQIDLGGRTWEFVVNLNVLSDVEELTGINLATRQAWDGLSLKSVRAFLWASFRESDPTVTLEEVGGWINLSNFAEVMLKFRSALTAAMVEEGEPEDAPLETTTTTESSDVSTG